MVVQPAHRLRLGGFGAHDLASGSGLIDLDSGWVNWEELRWYARVAMLNVLPDDDVFVAFGSRSNGAAVEVPEAHQRIVYGMDLQRGVQVVSLRGTKCRKSFAINLDTRFDSEASGKLPPLHRGYSRAGSACIQAVLPLLVPGIPLVLTGHSMGGALAIVLGLKLLQEGWDVDQVVTFGAPKVGPKECKSSCSALNILRVSHADDLVVYLPPTKLTGYCHLGTNLLLASAAAPMYGLLSPEEDFSAREAVKKVLSVGADRNRVHRASCHRMARYLSTIEEYVSACDSGLNLPYRVGERELYMMEKAGRRQSNTATGEQRLPLRVLPKRLSVKLPIRMRPTTTGPVSKL